MPHSDRDEPWLRDEHYSERKASDDRMPDAFRHTVEEPRRLLQGSDGYPFETSFECGREPFTQPFPNRLIVISRVASFKPGDSMKFNHDGHGVIREFRR